jgi:hypothetical protein
MGADCGNKEPGLFSSFAGCCDSRRGVGLVPQRKLHVEGGGDGRPAATWQGRPGASGDSGGGQRLSTPVSAPQQECAKEASHCSHSTWQPNQPRKERPIRG